MNSFFSLFSHPWFWAGFMSWCVAQFIKMMCDFAKTRRFDFSYFVSTGGMPSAHSALVSGLATAIGLTEGFGSPMFVLALTFASVTMFDAAGVRQAAGQQAKILNVIIDDLMEKGEFSFPKLKELLGHTRHEVFAGLGLGIVVTILIFRFWFPTYVWNPCTSRTWTVMGTVASYSTYGSGDVDSESEIVRGAFNDVEREFSVFREDSVLSQLNKSGKASIPLAKGPCECDLAGVVTHALSMATRTDGAFDPTVNPLMRLWGFRRANAYGELERLPTDAEIADVLSHVGWRHVSAVTNGAALDVSFDVEGIELDLGGIAKGYAVDLAYERLVAAGATNFLINLGGNIRVNGKPGRRPTFKIEVCDPSDPSKTTGDVVELHSGQAVATSGSYERNVQYCGKRYSHIIDPRNGRPVDRMGSYTSVKDTAMEADSTSTAGFVLGF